MTTSKKNTRTGGIQLSRTQISAAVVASLMSTGAMAQASVELVTSTPSATYTVVGNPANRSHQDNVSAIGASAVGNTVGSESSGDTASSSVSISTNSVRAGARANVFTGTVDLALADGVGVASGAAQFNTGALSSAASGNTLGSTFNTLTASSAEVLANTISATTTVNASSQALAGELPVGYVSTVGALATYGGSPASVAQGTLVVHSFQRARATAGTTPAATATTTGNEIGLDVDSTASALTASSPRLDNNTINAALTNNTATNLIDLQAGGSPAFVGSAVISNDQAVSSTAGTTSRPSTAATSGSAILATIGSDDGVNTLTGTLSVAGNAVTSSATSNETAGASNGVAGNRIVIGDGVAFQGAGGGAVASASYASGLDYTAQASLAISNHQEAWTPLSSATQGTYVGSAVQSINGGSVALADNTVSARATGNLNSSEVAAQGAAAFSGSVALQNSQQNLFLSGTPQNERASVTATVTDADILSVTGVDGGVTHASTVGVTGNDSSASAYGNQSSQNIALAANTLALNGPTNVALTSGVAANLNVSAAAALAVSSLQINQNAAITATGGDLRTGLYADSQGDALAQPASYNTILGSTLNVTDNAQQAVAVGNNVGNGVSLAVTTLDSGSAGISNAQFQTGQVGAGLSNASVGMVAGTHVSGSDLTVGDNLQRAVAYGNLGSNSIAVEANAVSLQPAGSAIDGSTVFFDPTATNGRVFDAGVGGQPAVSAVYGVLNNQAVSGPNAGVSASAASVGANLTVEGNITGSTAATTGNVVLGAAYGNDATNRASLDVGSSLTVAADAYARVAQVSNTQVVGGANTAISASAGGGETVSTLIERNVVDSTVAASSNAIEAMAYGSRAVNSVAASGNEITVTSPGGAQTSLLGMGMTMASTDAAFGVLNAQSGQGSVTASLVDSVGAPTDSASVRVQVGRAANSNNVLQSTLIDNATVRADSNTLLAQAVSNGATNSVATSANTLAASGALLNMQATSANVVAVVGAAGTPGTTGSPPVPGAPFTPTVTGDFDTATFSLGAWNVTGDLVVSVLDNPSLTTGQIQALVADGYAYDSSSQAYRKAVVNQSVQDATYQELTSAGSTNTAFFGLTSVGTPAVPATAGTPNAGGVTLAVTGGASVGVSNSSLSVAGNSTSGLVTGNSATNSVSASGNAVGGTSAFASTNVNLISTDASADHVLTNVQSVSSAALSSTVNGTYAIDVTTDAAVPVAITGSTLAVDGNAQTARAVANSATNSVSMEANQLAATSALLSVQGNSAAIAATSNLELFAPAAVSQSTVSLSNNSNVALGVANDVSNRTTVQGGASVASQGTGSANATYIPVAANNVSADHVVTNQQASNGTSVSSTASTSLYNQDGVLDTTPGLSASSLTISGNSTIAEASANRATNSLSVVDAASLGASTAVLNVQTNASQVSASATASVGVALNGGNLPLGYAADGSSIALNGNSTSALARGNTATNVLNAAPGANYVNTGAPAVLSTTTATAPAVVVNNQANSADVSASSNLVSYRVSLSDGSLPLNGAAIGSSIGVIGNSAMAQAYGNSATNALTLSALNTGVAAGGVSNTQSNTGAVNASTSSTSVGVQLASTFGTSLGGSTARVTGNQLGATAVGNSAVSTIAAR
ncbi:MAG: S-layer family protein [Comamonadaceae bacterium]|nr:MAG: S-layer family protein [Comamonadaceae bacterium]